MKIEDLNERVSSAKAAYNAALMQLEEISEQIHRLRKEREGGGQSPSTSASDGDVAGAATEASGGASSVDEDTMDDVISRFNSTAINSTDEYLDFPQKMSVKSSPVRQKNVGELDCPHMYQDFQGSSSGNAAATGGGCSSSSQMTNEAIEQWTEIRLSPSSSSSGYSNNGALEGLHVDDATQADDHSSSSSSSNSDSHKKVTCTTVLNSGGGKIGSGAVKREGISSWLIKSDSIKSTGRRQSLDLLIDAGDRVKDVFTNISFTKVGKTMERRNSESEIAQTEQTGSSDFFSFR